MKKSFYLLILSFALTYCSTAQHLTQTAQSDSAAQQQDVTTRSDSLQARSEYIRGITEFELKGYKSAMNHLTKAYVVLPNDPAINYALADTYLKLDDMANAEYYAKQAVKLDPDNKWYRLKLAQINQANGDLKNAEVQLQKILELHPNDVDLLHKVADLQKQEEHYDDANRTLDRIMALTGQDPRIYYQKFLNFNKSGQTDSALSVLQHLYKLDPTNMAAVQTLGEYYENMGHQRKAEKLYLDALKKSPDEPDVVLHLAQLYLNEARWDSAGTLLQSVIRNQNVEASEKVDVIKHIIDETQKKDHPAVLDSLAGKLIHTFLNANPDNATAHAMSAHYQLARGHLDKAINELQTSAELDSTNEMVWQQLIQLQFSRRNYQQVIAAGKKAVNSTPDNAFIQFAVGSAYMAQGKSHQAVPWLKKASTLPSRRSFKSIIYGSLGDAYSAVGDTANADSSYSQAVHTDQTNDNALNNYAYFLAKQGNRLDDARIMILKALSISPNSPAYLDTAGWVYFKLGQYDKARDYILKSVKTGTPDAEVMEHLGDVYQKLNDMNNARYWWKKALEKDSTRTYLKKRISK